jgi:hypothetical protein
MQYHLLSLLTEIENAIRAVQAATGGASMDASRMVNFQTGLARLSLKMKTAADFETRGHVQLQHFHLSDGRTCVKVHLSWTGSDARRTIDLFTLPNRNWSGEAQRVAEIWLDGLSSAKVTESTPLAATG